MQNILGHGSVTTGLQQHLSMKDEIYDPVAGSLKGQGFQGGCHQKEVVRRGGRGQGGGVLVGDSLRH